MVGVNILSKRNSFSVRQGNFLSMCFLEWKNIFIAVRNLSTGNALRASTEMSSNAFLLLVMRPNGEDVFVDIPC